MSTPDDFESESGDATSSGVKHYQITVPKFSEGSSVGPAMPGVYDATGHLATDAHGKTVPVPALSNASSFLRLGSPPDPTNDWSHSPFQNSVNLARLVGDPWVIAAAENMTLNGAAVTGTVTDSSTASSMVTTTGSSGTSSALAASSWSENFSDGAGNPSITSDDGSSFGALYQVGDGTSFGNAFNTNQDASYFPGFADDTRQRGTPAADPQSPGACPTTTNISNSAQANVIQNRQAETLKLLSKGGWWDHSDGNRVTTTSGDKIEVIEGNYKLVVLGRQSVPTPPAPQPTQGQTEDAYAAEVDAYRKKLVSLAGNSFITDVSGGHFQEQYPSPTPCIKTIEYVQDAGGEWTLYQDNGIGNLVTKLKGRTVDLFQGQSREAYVGSNAALTDSTTGIALDPMIASYTWAASVFSQTGSPDKPIGATQSGRPANAAAGPNPQTGVQNGGVKQGDVVSQTWAARVMSYTGSSSSRVGDVRSETYAHGVYSLTDADTVTSVTMAAAVTTEVYGKGAVTTATQATGVVFNSTVAPAITTLNVAGTAPIVGGIANINASFGPIVNMNLAPTSGVVNIDWTPANRNVHIGTQSQEVSLGEALMVMFPGVTTLAQTVQYTAMYGKATGLAWGWTCLKASFGIGT
jgi:hypothetical protein